MMLGITHSLPRFSGMFYAQRYSAHSGGSRSCGDYCYRMPMMSAAARRRIIAAQKARLGEVAGTTSKDILRIASG